jgi:adenylate cyclase
VLNEEGEYTEYKTGDQYKFETRPLAHWNFVFPISVKANSKETFYLKLKMNGPVSIPMTLWEAKDFQKYCFDRMFIFGLFVGIMLIMLFYNLILYFGFKDISYLQFVLVIFFYIIVFLTFTGLDSIYVIPNHPEWGEYIHHFGIIGGVLSAYAFVFSLLDTERYAPYFHKFLKVFFYINILLFFLPFIFSLVVTIKLTIVNLIISVVSLFLIGILCYYNGLRSARFFLLASLFPVLGALSFALSASGLLPDIFFTRYSVQIGSVFQMMFFSFALSDRVHLLNLARETALTEKLKESEKVASLSRAFERFVPKQFLDYLQKESISAIKLGDNTQLKMSILFCDIRSFTDLSESMSPDDNFKFINEYLGRVGPFVRSHGGFIDKFIGDAIMALFPKNVNDAVDSAISIQQEVVRFNEDRIKRNELPIAIGIGIHTGNLMLGTVGEENRMDGTVISDAVNLASRIEGLTKSLGAPIIISEAAWLEIEYVNKYEHRLLGKMKVKGKKNAVSLIEIIENKSDERAALKIKTRNVFEKAIDLFDRGNFADAELEFRSLLKVFPNDMATEHYVLLCEREMESKNSSFDHLVP